MSKVYIEDVEIRSDLSSNTVVEYTTGTYKRLTTNKAVVTLVWEGNHMPQEIIDLFEKKGRVYE